MHRTEELKQIDQWLQTIKTGEDESRMEPGSSGTAPGTRPGREPTTGKQYFPGAGNRPGTAAEEATGGRTSAKEREED